MGWAGPVGPAAAAVAKSLSDTEGMGHGGTRSRYPYFVPRIRMCTCTISSRSSVTAPHGLSGLSVPTKDVPRRSNIYLSPHPPPSTAFSLSCFIYSWHLVISHSPSKSNIPTTSLLYHQSSPSHTQTSQWPVLPLLLPRTSSPYLRTSPSSSSSRPEVPHTSPRSTLIAHHSKSSSTVLLATL